GGRKALAVPAGRAGGELHRLHGIAGGGAGGGRARLPAVGRATANAALVRPRGTAARGGAGGDELHPAGAVEAGLRRVRRAVVRVRGQPLARPGRDDQARHRLCPEKRRGPGDICAAPSGGTSWAILADAGAAAGGGGDGDGRVAAVL